MNSLLVNLDNLVIGIEVIDIPRKFPACYKLLQFLFSCCAVWSCDLHDEYPVTGFLNGNVRHAIAFGRGKLLFYSGIFGISATNSVPFPYSEYTTIVPPIF